MDGLRAQGECARIAFSTLRYLQCQKDSSIALPYLQLESGMSALIGKLLALGFDDMALRELRILKRRLEASKVASPAQINAASAGPLDNEEKSDLKTETLAEILRFRNTNLRGQLLSLIITTQLQVLKILALKRDAYVTGAALQHLQFSAPHSPANLIQRQLESDLPGSKEKVVRQLESLTQALIALCPSISGEDAKLLAPGSNVSPDINLQIQVLAFQVRSTWWQISGHQGDIAKEIISPFSRCLANFSGQSKSTKAEKYEIAKKALEIINERVQKVNGFREEVLFLAYQALAELAQESSQYSQAIGWVRKARGCAPESTLSRVQLCSFSCRLASLEIKLAGSDSSEKLHLLLKDAAKSLEGNLHGKSSELDELLLSIASIRRSAFSVIQSNCRSSATTEIRAQSALVHACTNIVLLCARFLVRYVGDGNSREGHEKTTERRDQRRRLAARSTTATIESVLAMARLSADSEASIWDPLEMGLQDCARLISDIEGYHTNEDRASDKETRVSSFAQISNAYWYRYQFLKRKTTDVKAYRKCLLESIELIRDRPLCEKLAGSLPLKFETFGQLCEDIRDYKKAADSYEDALHVELDSGLFQRVMETAAVESIPNLLEHESQLQPLSRKLSAYLRAALKAVDQEPQRSSFYDAKWLSTSERGLLLERQLIYLLTNLNLQGPAMTITKTINDIGKSLLLTYEPKNFPVRRLSVVVRLLRSLLTAPEALGNDLVDQLLEEPTTSGMDSHSDVGLLNFQPHLLTCRRFLISLYQKPPNIKDLESVISSWSKLAQESVESGSLQTQVYDVADWLIQLEMLGEYLDMQGLELYRVSALNIAVIVHEAATSVQYSALVSKLSELGSQHVRLGYSGLAGSILHKAQRYLEASDLIDKVKLKWYVSYAEYALANGNLKTW